MGFFRILLDFGGFDLNFCLFRSKFGDFGFSSGLLFVQILVVWVVCCLVAMFGLA